MFLAISWVIFVFGLGLSSILASLLSFYNLRLLAFERPTKWMLWIAKLGIVALFALGIGAFMFLSLVTMAYSWEVGATSLVLNSGLALAGFLIGIYQICT